MQISKKLSKLNFYSFIWHSLFLALASNFMDVDTVIPAMLLRVGGTSIHLGFLTAILLGGSSIFQLLFAPIISLSSYKKKHLLLGINLRIFSLFFMAILFWFSADMSYSVIISLIFIFISIFSLSGSYANVSYIEMIGKSIRQEDRKSFFSLREIIKSVGVLLSALIVRELIKQYDYPFRYSLLFFIAAVLLLLASLGFWNIREIRSRSVVKIGLFNFLKNIPAEIKKNPNLKYYLLIINMAGFGIGFTPFMILLAKDSFSLSPQFIGNVLVLKIIGMVLTGSFLYKFSKKVKYKTILIFDIFLGASLPVLALLLKGYPVYYQFLFILSGVFVSLFKIANSGILLEISNNENRVFYAGISGAGKIFSALFPIIAGVLIHYIGFTYVFLLVSVSVLFSYLVANRLDLDN